MVSESITGVLRVSFSRVSESITGVLRVSFSRVSKSITGVFHFPAWDLLSTLAQTPDRRDQRLFTVSSERHRQSGVNEIAQASKRRR